MIDWHPVPDSSRITAEAYDEEEQKIYVRFPDGVEWWYAECPPHVWDEFTRPEQSRGEYINEVLDHKPHGEYRG